MGRGSDEDTGISGTTDCSEDRGISGTVVISEDSTECGIDVEGVDSVVELLFWRSFTVRKRLYVMHVFNVCRKPMTSRTKKMKSLVDSGHVFWFEMVDNEERNDQRKSI